MLKIRAVIPFLSLVRDFGTGLANSRGVNDTHTLKGARYGQRSFVPSDRCC